MLPYVDRILSTAREAEKALSRDVYQQQRLLKQRIPSFLRQGSLRNLLTTPIIYSLALPFLLLDAWVTAYQWVCFPIYGIDRVRRSRYLVIDRHKLRYLNAIEKANCVYCGYANGVLAADPDASPSLSGVLRLRRWSRLSTRAAADAGGTHGPPFATDAGRAPDVMNDCWPARRRSRLDTSPRRSRRNGSSLRRSTRSRRGGERALNLTCLPPFMPMNLRPEAQPAAPPR